MNVIIVGCGNVGYALVEKLSDEKHNVVVVDKDKKKVDLITDEQDVLGIVGDGINYQVLIKAGIEHTDLLIAVTESDEQNLLCCVMAKRSDKYCRTVARVRNPVYNTETSYLRRELGLALIINPELIAAAEIARRFQYPDSIHVDTFTRGRIELFHLELTEGNPLVGMSVGTVINHFKCHVLICAVQRKRKTFIPDFKAMLEVGDELILSATPKDANTFFKRTGINKHPLKSAMIVGGGTIGFYLANRLVETGVRTKIIESDTDRCEFLNEEIPKATVINGDGSDEKLLIREGIGGVGAFAALTGIDEENVLLSLFAQRVSHANIMTKLRRLNYTDIIQEKQLENTIFPENMTAEYIVRYARSMSGSREGGIENIFTLAKSKAKVMEYFVQKSCAVTEKPISQLKLKEGLLICSITRNERLIVPGGRDEIRVGDNVLILTMGEIYNDIEEIIDK
ncbi:MAG: Trk system potassium transporter TrkA [Lachnospiraceae bacterium]|nr:Trk system potassium transporter TrkA [Lachnospiraceae bacterium]MBQ9606511.1 Trk system potassium transporter TrkA [Lachnospiraceae bacterium]